MDCAVSTVRRLGKRSVELRGRGKRTQKCIIFMYVLVFFFFNAIRKMIISKLKYQTFHDGERREPKLGKYRETKR